jgi:ABC-type nitrate/sulfonate/bicarbonate transport system permease component
MPKYAADFRAAILTAAVAVWLILWWVNSRLSALSPQSRTLALLRDGFVALSFGVVLLFLWEVVVRAFEIPFILLPPPSAIGARIASSIPILAIAPMVIVVFAAIGITGIIPKSLISTYLSFFPVAVGMVKGLRSPELTHLDLMHTYNASASQIFWKLRVPASVPFLFTSMKVAVAASLVGAIVAELPTGAVAGIGAKLLSASYYSQTIDMWSALVAGSIVAALLVTVVGLAGRFVDRSMGARPA